MKSNQCMIEPILVMVVLPAIKQHLRSDDTGTYMGDQGIGDN